MNHRILVFDPGNHTGWVFRDDQYHLSGGMFYEDITRLPVLFDTCKPDVVVYETFNMYPGAAPHLVHNDFYPCQVIGVIRFLCVLYHVPFVVPQAPSVKRYAKGLDDRWSSLRSVLKLDTVEHTKDSYLHLQYYEQFNERLLNIKYKAPESF